MTHSRGALGQKRVRQRKLGRILLEEGFISSEQLQSAITEQKSQGGLLGELLVTAGFVTEWEVAKCLVSQFQLPFIFTSHYEVSQEAAELLPRSFLHENKIVPLDVFGGCLALATTGNITSDLIDEIENTAGLEVALYVALGSDVKKTLQDRFPLDNPGHELKEPTDGVFQET